MTKDDNSKKVYAAINAVQNALKAGIPKDHKNAMQGYNFRGIDDIYNVVGPLLPEHGLVILPKMVSRECEAYKNAKGNTMFHVVVKAEYRFVAAADGSCEVVEMFGEAMDSSDKATNKAMSAAYKYACIQTFSIPVTGEPDADAESPEVPKDEERLPTRPVAKLPAEAPKTPPRGVQRQETASGNVLEWRGHLTSVKAVPGKKANGEPYTVYFIAMELSETGETKEAATFDEDRYTECQFWPQEDEVVARVRPSLKRQGKFEFLGLKLKGESELELVEE